MVLGASGKAELNLVPRLEKPIRPQPSQREDGPGGEKWPCWPSSRGGRAEVFDLLLFLTIFEDGQDGQHALHPRWPSSGQLCAGRGQPNGQAPGRTARDQLSNVDRAAVVTTAPWRRSPPRPSLRALDFFNSVRAPRASTRVVGASARCTVGFVSVPGAPALVGSSMPRSNRAAVSLGA
jgi:hypothetical protein